MTLRTRRTRGDRIETPPEYTRPRAIYYVLALGVAALAIVPLTYLALRAVEAGFDDIVEVLTRPRVLELTLNSVLLAVSVGVSCLVLGTASGWLLSRVILPARRAWFVAATLPLAVPSYIAAYGWLVIDPRLSGFLPSWVILTAVCTPYVTLPVAAVLRTLSDDHELVSRSLGRGPIATFFAATWPRISRAAVSGALVALLYALSEFGAVSMLRFPTLPWGIHSAYAASFDRFQAAILAVVLVLLALIVVAGERSAHRGDAPQAARRSLPSIRLTGAARFALLLLVVPAVIGVAVPLGGLLTRLLQAESVRDIDIPRLTEATAATLELGAAGAIVTVILVLPVAILAARGRGRIVAVIESLSLVGHAIPAIVVGLAVVFVTLGVIPILYQSVAALLLAYAVLFLPRAIGPARSGIAAVPSSLLDVSGSLGVAGPSRWARLSVPLSVPSLAVAALLVAISVMKELPATLLLRPTEISTLATELWSRTAASEFGAAAPYAAVLVVVAAVPAVLLSHAGAARDTVSTPSGGGH